MSIEYTTRAGNKVVVPTSMDPFKQLGISSSASTEVTKRAVRREMLKPKRQDRAMASLAYHMITSSGNQYQKKGTVYRVISPDVFFFAAIGHRDKVIAKIEEDARLIRSVDEHRHTVMYLAARCGFSDIVETLVRKGAVVNHRQCDNSTPLHVATFYGQREIARMLLVYGADPTLKNDHNHTPIQEASGDTKKVFEDNKNYPFRSSVNFFNSSDATEGMRYISYRNKTIGAEIFRSKSQLDDVTRKVWSSFPCDWEVAYHGTKLRYVKSILRHGLLPSGASLPSGEMIKPPPGHIAVDVTYAGVKEWAKAIFVSPNIMYASNKTYSEYVHRGDSQWCIIMKVFVNPSSYKSYDSTLLFTEQPIEGEPTDSEYRIQDTSEHHIQGNLESRLFRIISDMTGIKVEASRNVVVASVIFMDLKFRRDVTDFRLNHDDLRKLFHDKTCFM